MTVLKIIRYMFQLILILLMSFLGVLILSTMLPIIKAIITMILILVMFFMLAWEFRDIDFFERY
jgi:hypothetical protein